MSFLLSSSEWSEEEWVYTDESEPIPQNRLSEAIESLHQNRSVLFHPRAELSDCEDRSLVVYRSGRIEWCGKSCYTGYDPESAHLWATGDKAVELWLRLLRGDIDVINREPWQKSFDTHCHICGYDLGFPPWGTTGQTPEYDICPCCRTEFGAEDRWMESLGRLREIWIAGGYKWFNSARQPADWSPEKQLMNVPTDLMEWWPFWGPL